MKRTLTIALVLALLVGSLFALTGCGQENNEALSSATGKYKGLYTKFVGDDDSAKVEDEAFDLELKADGTGTHNRDDSSFNVTWSLEGDQFTMKETFLGMSIEYTGTLVDGKLDIFNGEPSDDLTCEYVYEKQ